ncbi:MAG TPA: transcriptional regulator [Gammaproteobacteria bacterium]|nr:transcriptional regulator [Gammaproteobacteria bacterium]
MTKTVKVGIMPLAEFKKYTLAIARGSYKPKPDEPKIWFPSIKSLALILSEENQALLKLILDMEPQSVKEIESLTGRKANNILRTLRSMEHLGLVKLLQGKQGKGRLPLIPKVIYDKVTIELSFSH